MEDNKKEIASAQGQRKKAKSGWIWFVVMAALLGWTAWTVFREQTPGQLLRAVTRADWRYVLVGLGVMALFIACEAKASHAILKALGSPQRFRRCCVYSCAGFFFSNITPSATGGQPAQIYYMNRDGSPVAHGAIDMLLVTIAYHTAAVLFGVASLFIFPDLPEVLGGKVGLLLGLGFAIFLGMDVVMILFLFQPGLSRRLGRWGIGALARLKRDLDRDGLENKLEEQLESYGKGARLIRAAPGLLPKVFLLIAGQLSCSYAVPFFICLALHVPHPAFLQVFSLQVLCSMAVGYLPLPGSAGAAENVFLRSFVFLFGRRLVAPAMILSRTVSCYLPLIVTGLVTAAVHIALRKRARTS